MNTAVSGSLVQFTTDDGLRLSGLLSGTEHATTIIHLHGKCGNFYDNKFVKEMFQFYPQAGINFLGFNNRGAASLNETPTRSGEFIYTGTAVERIEDCVYDISAAVKFAKAFSDRIILQGHSFGCEKALHYLLTADEKTTNSIELILLSPTDGYALHDTFLGSETVEQQRKRLRKTYNEDTVLLPRSEYGIRNAGVEYFVPITAEALLGLIDGPAFSLLNLNSSSNWKLDNRALCYLSEKDALQVDPAKFMWRYISERIPNCYLSWRENSAHDLRPDSLNIMEEIECWIKTV